MKAPRKKKITLEDVQTTLKDFYEEFVGFKRDVNQRFEAKDAEHRKIGVILEDIQTQLKQSREAYDATNNRLDDLAHRVDRGFEDMDFKFERMIEILDQKADKPALLT